MLSEIFMQINHILTKLRQLKLGSQVIMPYRVDQTEVINTASTVQCATSEVCYALFVHYFCQTTVADSLQILKLLWICTRIPTPLIVVAPA